MTSYYDGPKPIFTNSSPIRSSWDNIQSASSGGVHHSSTATVNSLHSSSHSSSSNQSSGEPLPLSYSLGSHSSIPDKESNPGPSSSTSRSLIGAHSSRVGIPVGITTPTLADITKGTSYSQPFLNSSSGKSSFVLSKLYFMEPALPVKQSLIRTWAQRKKPGARAERV